MHLLHISKTGGTTVRQMFKTAGVNKTRDGRAVVLDPHQITMPDVLRQNDTNEVTFFLRHPVSRFVSGFNSRLRQGEPSHFRPWSDEEREVYESFPTANDLAESLSAEGRRQDEAISAIRAINHTRWRLTDWLVSPQYLESRLDRIAFVGFQETFAEDAEALIKTLRIRQTVEVAHHHAAPPSTATDMSDVAKANIEQWYSADVELYEWALARRDQWKPRVRRRQERRRNR